MSAVRAAAAAVLLGLAALIGAACAGDDAAGPASSDTTGAVAAGPTSVATTPARPTCDRPPAAPPVAAAVPGTPPEVTSFDGTTIRTNWFPHPDATADAPAPVVLMGPGWSLPGDTDVDAVGVLGAINIASLRDAGFSVLTWDPRGFGASGGVAEVNAPDAEGRDVQVLLDWVAAQPGVRLDAPGDPRAGMVGGSYGGGIQLTVAAEDCRVDAIVPVIAWHSLRTSLYRSDTMKQGWAGRLVEVAARGRLAPQVTGSYATASTTGTLPPADVDWFVSRGPGDAVGRITAPTLLVGGTVDNLFTLDETVANHRLLAAAGTPVSMLWYCGGHGACLTPGGDPERVSRAALAWLRRHVAGDASVDTGPAFDTVDQRGERHTAATYPLPPAGSLAGSGGGTLALTGDGGSGPATPGAGPAGIVDSLALPITPARATNAVEVPVPVGGSAGVVVGAPQLELAYRGTTPPGERPVRVFAQLVDDATGVVVGNQVTPVPLVLDGTSRTLSLPLETVVFAADLGASLTLQLVPTTVAYALPRLGGEVTVERATVTLPLVGGLTRAG